MSLVIDVKFLHPDAQMPVRSTEFAGAYDVHCVSVTKSVDSEGYPVFICHTGLAIQPPENYRVMIHPRSSIFKYPIMLANGVGIGDADYIDEYRLIFKGAPNIDSFKFPYKPGDRVGQIYFEEVEGIVFNKTYELKKHARKGGFGSTGK